MTSFGKEEFSAAINVSRETLERLESYESLLNKWNPAVNLISRSSIKHLWHRHFLDSAQIWRLAPKNCYSWLDLGSGGGLPGIVIAILAAQSRPEMTVTMIESDLRKSAFLSEVTRQLGLNAKIIPERIESAEPQAADVISARALAPLTDLLRFSAPHGNKNAIYLFHKGKNFETELTEASKIWHFSVETTQSITDSESEILKISGVARKNAE